MRPLATPFPAALVHACVPALALALVLAPAAAAGALPADGFAVGVWADEGRTLACVETAAGGGFRQYVWTSVPPEGLAYLTLRFQFSPNLDLTARPTLHEAVTGFIVTDYPLDTVEWNLVLGGCPGGWFMALSQWCVVLDPAPCTIRILAADSMARDCGFELHGVEVLSGVAVNDPACGSSPAPAQRWGAIKGLYR